MLKSLKIFCSMKRFSPALDHKGWKSERANERVNLIKGVLIREKKKREGRGRMDQSCKLAGNQSFAITNT